MGCWGEGMVWLTKGEEEGMGSYGSTAHCSLQSVRHGTARHGTAQHGTAGEPWAGRALAFELH